MEKRDFRIAKLTRDELHLTTPVFTTDQSLQALYNEANELTYSYNLLLKQKGTEDSSYLTPGKLHACAVLHLLYQIVLSQYLQDENPDYFSRVLPYVAEDQNISASLAFYAKQFPSPLLQKEKPTAPEFMQETMRGFFIHQVMLYNPALVKAAKPFIVPEGISFPTYTKALTSLLGSYIKDASRIKDNDEEDIFAFLTKPSRLFPNNLKDQIQFILREWPSLLPDELKLMLQSSLDFINEEERDHGFGGAPGPMPVPDYSSFGSDEYEAFSADTNWMPNVVMMAKCTLVWLDQLTKWYGYPINTLDKIPDHELDMLKERGFTALWLIGLWERSEASKTIKNLCGNPDAEASAYSLKNYEISSSIGGWDALENLRKRCNARGIRLASDMVPNHTGIDGDWVYSHPEYYVSQDYSPFPSYSYNGPDLSKNPDIEIKLEDHYYNRTDAAVTFRRRDKRNGQTSYVFHGNDGTTMPWNDTAQLDYLNPITREAVIQQIIHVAKNFPIIRFDAAMTLAKRHIQRLWYPKPGCGGDIAGRAVHAISDQDFNASIPQEFWREVVDRIAKEVPDTLLLAEAFWMMEGYFVRTLGMHRVYNSAFMNMLKNQENQKYRQAIKNTLAYEPEILKRYVNFMNNPDEETAVAQFGDGNRYFSICTILSTLPGLPMFGHGQIEGFKEKYGMEYKRAYWEEKPNDWIIEQHYHKIFPLLRKRYLFSGVEHFNIYDCYHEGHVEESVFAYANGTDSEKTLVIVNNQYERVYGNIKLSAPKLKKNPADRHPESISLAENLGLTFGGRRFVIYDNFSSGLTYLLPSIKVFEEGFNFTIDGYDSIVLWNIREVEDIDGSYEKLYGLLGTNGVVNIAVAIALLRLQPVFKILDIFRHGAFFKEIENICHGQSTPQTERSLLLSIAECYTHLTGEYDYFEEATKAELPREPREIDPASMVSEIKYLGQLFSKKNPSDVFKHYALIAPELPLILTASITLKPFISENCSSPLEAVTATDKLLLDHFFENSKEKLGFDDKQIRIIMHAAALSQVIGNIVNSEKPMKAENVLAKLMEDKVIRNFVQANEYKGITWYNKEAMQMLILISALSISLFEKKTRKFNADSFIRTLLEKESKAEYQLAKLLG